MYGSEVEFYDITSRNSWEQDKKIIDEIMPLVRKKGIVFDIGAGTGNLSIYISEMFDCEKIYAIEKSPEMRIALMSKLQNVIAKKNNITVIDTNIFEIEFTKDISAVFLMGVVGHFNMYEREFLWKNLGEKLEKEAPILISNLSKEYFYIKNGTVLENVRVGDYEYELIMKEKKHIKKNKFQWKFLINLNRDKVLQRQMVYTLEWENIDNECIINELHKFGIKGVQISNNYIIAYRN